jgi:hypothetical protein
MLCRHGTGDPALVYEIARSWRLGRQVIYVNCLGPANTEARTTARALGADRGETPSSQALMPGAYVPRASVEFSKMEVGLYLLVFGVVMTKPVENRLARPIRNPPSNRRACVAWWSQVIHRYPPLLESWRGNPLTVARPVQSP